jgi:hypothetical protein
MLEKRHDTALRNSNSSAASWKSGRELLSEVDSAVVCSDLLYRTASLFTVSRRLLSLGLAGQPDRRDARSTVESVESVKWECA